MIRGKIWDNMQSKQSLEHFWYLDKIKNFAPKKYAK